MKEISADEFAQRLDALRGSIKSVLRRFAVPADDAEDVMQEVFVIVWQKWDAIEDLERFIVGVARNRCWLWLKRRLRLRGLLEPMEAVFSEPPIPPPQLAVEQEEWLSKVLAQLRPRERQAMILRRLGYTHEEVCEALGLASGSARKLYSRALEKIKSQHGGRLR